MILQIFVIVLIVVLIAAYLYLNYTLMQQGSKITTLQSTLGTLLNNVEDIQTIANLNTTVQGLQSNPVNTTTTAITPALNTTISSVTAANGINFAFSQSFSVTHYTFSVVPNGSGTLCYIDIPLLGSASQSYVLSNRGISDSNPSTQSANIVNDIRTIFSTNGTLARVFFTSNNTSAHNMSVTIIASK